MTHASYNTIMDDIYCKQNRGMRARSLSWAIQQHASQACQKLQLITMSTSTALAASRHHTDSSHNVCNTMEEYKVSTCGAYHAVHQRGHLAAGLANLL